jgi:type II secretory pathway predicted ATPase ExeA
MYTNYWKLEERPFDNRRDGRFYYPGQSHQATLLKLRYAIEHRSVAALLAGPSGCGKSLLINALFDELSDEYQPLVHVRFPQMAPAELLAYLAAELTGDQLNDGGVDHSLRAIQRVLEHNAQEDRHAVIVIDEAHLLRDTETIETVRLLLNFEPALSVLMVAQPALLPALDRLPELEERIGVKCLLRHFSSDETIAYISHRLLAAGAEDVHAIFEPDALERIHTISAGVPRRINRVCDLALLIGYAEEQPKITTEHIQAVAEELLSSTPEVRRAA